MIYEHPLAYVLGLEGIALLRAFGGEYDRAFVEQRLAEIRRLLDDESLTSAVDVARVDSVDGYRIWSRTYDSPNSAFDLDEPVVKEIIDTLPAGVALDAACGTGRYAAALAERGHQVIGVDSSPDMLARARDRVPTADFRVGNLHQLPVGDNAVDLVVCALALTHLESLEPAFTEFTRVLRPGGHLVIADMHHESIERVSVPTVHLADGRPGRLPAHRHLVGDYLRAALPRGLTPRRCEEPRMPIPAELPDATTDPGPWEYWPWSLSALVPEAAAAANTDVPALLVWHFQN